MEDRGSMIWTEDLLGRFRGIIAEARSVLTIFSPYIRVDALRAILTNAAAKSIEIVTVWSARAVLDGCADLDIYPYAKSIGARLYLLPRLHMKAIVADRRCAVVSTANITGHGIGIVAPPNIECAALVSDLNVADQLWFVKQLQGAALVQDDYYLAFFQHVESQRRHEAVPVIEQFVADAFVNRRQFLLDALPRTATPEALLAGILRLDAEGAGSIESEDLAALLHDCALYGLEPNCGAVENWRRLRHNFLGHPFVAAFLASFENRRYFGEAKAWLQNHCADLPAPPRRELTGHTRVFFDWVSVLAEDEFALVRPRYSECLVRRKMRGGSGIEFSCAEETRGLGHVPR